MAKSIHTAEQILGEKSIPLNVSLSNDGITTKQGWKGETVYLWDKISELEVEGPDAIQKRITASRLLMTGVFAFAFKKKTGEAFVFISFKDGKEPLVLKFPKKSEPELKAIFSPYRSRITITPTRPTQVAENDSVEQLTKLGVLFEKGLIDEAEFKASKAKILGIN
jgi:hypothetical protein